MLVGVECHSGFTYAEKPVAFILDDQRYEITAILAYWIEPDGRHFRVRTRQGQLFGLVYQEAMDNWQATILEEF